MIRQRKKVRDRETEKKKDREREREKEREREREIYGVYIERRRETRGGGYSYIVSTK